MPFGNKNPAPTPEIVGQWNWFMNHYGDEYGDWSEVERVASWPEGREVAEFLQTIEDRLQRNGKIPQHGWHSAKLFNKVRKIVPEHGARYPYLHRIAEKKRRRPPDPNGTGDYQPATGPYQGQAATGPYAGTASASADVTQRMDAIERRLQALELRLQQHTPGPGHTL